MGRPSGTVTFLFTDVEGSTRLWEAAPESMRVALAHHDGIVRKAVDAHGGYAFATGGDGLAAAFSRAGDAVSSAIDAQAALGAECWPEGTAIRVRMGLHTGEVEERDGDYFGPAVNRAARVMAVGHGGQILVSAATAAMLAEVELVDLGAHYLRDLVIPEHLWQVGAGTFPPVRSLSKFRTNITRPPTSFVGREVELAEIGALLGDHRLVTLTGPGGAGKTRLALQVAAEEKSQFPDGIWLVELGRLQDPDGIPTELGAALEVVAAPGQSLTERAEEFLADRQALVIVDNCEHIIADAADLAVRLISACGGLSVLSTSRESLAVPAEQVYRVGPMIVEAEAGGLSDAARLFVDRVRRDRSGFEVTDANREAVEQICTRLDGMPLAIELAAGRAHAMGPSEIASRLGERFKLLGGGTRGRVERHQTLRATVEWSYDLLDPDERDLFARLSVFAGTFDLDAAVAVGAPLDEFAVLDGLGSLVGKSMVVVDDHSVVGTRYRLLETLRAFGHLQLDTAGLLDSVRQVHASHYTARAAAAARDLYGPDTGPVGGRMLADAADYREAKGWLVAAGQLDMALALAVNLALLSYWWDWWEPYAWLDDVLADPASAGCPRRSAALGALSFARAMHEADLVGAERVALAAIEARASHPEIVEPFRVAEQAMSTVTMLRGDFDASLGWAEQLIDVGRADDDWSLGWGLFYASVQLSFSGRTDEARSLIDQLEGFCRRHPFGGTGWTVNYALGIVYVQADPERARRHFELALEEGRALGSPALTRTAAGEAMSLLIAHAPLPQAAGAAREVIEAMWDARDLGVMVHHVANSVVLCARAGRGRDAAMIDGWLGERGHNLAPVDLARHQQAQADIDAHLGDDAARLRAQGAQWEPATAIEHILTTLRAISETPPPVA